MEDDPIYTAEEAAAYMRMPLSTLYVLNHRGTAPARMRVGKRVLYRRSALDAYLDEHLVTDSSEGA